MTIMAGNYCQALFEVHRDGDRRTRESVIRALAGCMAGLEPVMDLYGLPRDAEGLARAMVLTEDLIGCQPAGSLLSVSSDEAIRRVTGCPWAASFSDDGGTCEMVMAALTRGLGEKLGLEAVCEQSLARGDACCLWKVRKKEKEITDENPGA